MKKNKHSLFLWGGLLLSALLCGGYALILQAQTEQLMLFGLPAIFLFFFGIPVILLAIKSQRSHYEVNKHLQILAWELDGEMNKQPLRRRLLLKLAVLFAAAVVFFAVLWLTTPSMNVLSCAVLSIAALLLFGGTVLYLHENAFALYGYNSFVLCHNALYLSGALIKLDGQKNAVFEVALDSKKHILRLGIMQKGQNGYIQVPVPNGETEKANAFIADLSAHFENNKPAAQA